MTNKTMIHHPEVLALKAKFAENNFAIFDLGENSMIFPSRKALPDHGMPKDEHLTAMLQYVPESNGWILVFQVKMRKIDGNDPKFGEEPTKKLLEAVCELMKQEFPTVDEEGTLPLKWEVDLDAEAITNENVRIGVTQAHISIIIDVENLFHILKSLEHFPEVAFQDFSELSVAEQEAVLKEKNRLPHLSSDVIDIDMVQTKS